MQMVQVSLVFVALLLAPAGAADSNPLSKVIELMDSLAAKVTKEGEAEEKAYEEYVQWCEDTTPITGFEIQTLNTNKGKLEAAITKASNEIEDADSHIEDLASAIDTAEGELKEATAMREKEHKDFLAAEAELVEAIDMLERDGTILSRERAKNPAAIVQVDTSSVSSLIKSLGAVIDAAGLSSSDRQGLVALMQSQNDDSDAGASAAAVYKTHSTNIVELLESMKDKAEGELADVRKAETTAKHNYEMLKQSLDHEIAKNNKHLEKTKRNKAAAQEAKAAAEGDLADTVKALAEAVKNATAQRNCMQLAQDHAKSVEGRAAELKAIHTAKKILEDKTKGAEENTYSLLHVSTNSRRTETTNAQIVSIAKGLADKHHYAVLAQLVYCTSAVLKTGGAGGDDVFAKVKSLITAMIERLTAEAAAEATEKAYCDEQMAKTEAKNADLEDDVEKLTAKIDQAAAKSAALKADVKQLQAELSALAKLHAEMDKTRADQNKAFLELKADMEQGLAGVRKALQALREYYANDGALLQQQAMPKFHSKATGAGTGIIDILEVVESDFAKNLATETTQENDAQAAYDKQTQENAITKTLKDQDVKYKTKEAAQLDKAVSELSSDRDTGSTELAAVNEYYAKLKDRCIAKPETYEERKRSRAAEIGGFKEALRILESETAFMQRDRRGFLG